MTTEATEVRSRRRHRLSAGVWSMFADNPVLLAIAGIGFAVSFQTITNEARLHHLPGWPVLYPILIDLGIFGFAVEARKAIADNRSDLVPRALAWLLSAFTLYVNAHGSPSRDWVGITLHVAAPVLWIAFLELTRWRKLRKQRAGQRDRIPLARWFVAPVRTAGMRKRMILHNVSSYAEASAREEARLAGLDLAAAVFGKRWKRAAPRLLVHHLTEGTLPADVAQAAEFQSRDLPERVEEWVMSAHASRVRAAAKVRQQTREADAPDAPKPRPRQRAKATRVTGSAAARARAEELLRDNPRMDTADVVRESGASRSTVQRIKRDTPRALRPVRNAAEG